MLFLLGLLSLALLFPTSSAIPAGRCAKIEKRREWRTFSNKEKASYVDAVKCLATKPSSIRSQPMLEGASLYDDFAWAHFSVLYTQHWTASFLVWHRAFLQKYHDALKTQCGYRGAMAWWDWEQDYNDLPNSPVFSPDPKTGFGTNGHGVVNAELGAYALTDGAFANRTSPVVNRHLVSRNFSTPSTYGGPDMGVWGKGWLAPSYMRKVHDAPSFIKFWYAVEGTNYYTHRGTPAMRNGPHSDVHLFIGGDMAAIPFSVSDPLFFLHHGKVDQLWAKWQARDPSVRRDASNRLAYSGNRIQNSTADDAQSTDILKFNGLGDDMTVASVFDTTAFPFCYEY